MNVLVVNAGSSSVRLARFVANGSLQLVGRRHFDGPSVQPLYAFLAESGDGQPDIIAHRIVHGGADLVAPCEIDSQVEAEIRRLGSLAPLHNPIAAEWIAACRAEVPSALQVAIFDTSFFAWLPDEASTYALPRDLCRRLGLRRFGFHGIAHQAMWRAWRRVRPNLPDGGKLVSFQLGAGASVAAILGGRPVDTSMGFTPLEGLVMATRAGDLDPGLVLHLLSEDGGLSPSALSRLLEERSGLLGLAGSSDLRELLATDSEEARLAVAVYCRRAKKYLGAYLALLGGADGVAFGGGVGEHVPEVRARIVDGLAWCGLRLDGEANRRAHGESPARISAAGSPIQAWVLPVDEETVIAEDALAVATRANRFLQNAIDRGDNVQ